MKNRVVISIIVLVCLAALAVVFFVFLWPQFNKAREEDETTAAGTAAATKAPYAATTKTRSADEATAALFDIGEAHLIVTIKEPNFSDEFEPEPEVRVFANPEVGTVVVDGLFMVSESKTTDDFGERRERHTTPGSIYITGVSDTSIDLLVDYHEEIEEGDETVVAFGKVNKAGSMSKECKLKVNVDKDETYCSDDGQVITFRYEYVLLP